ncbi:MAG: O-antigen ligase family protein [Cytophagales bacterium]|nr:O-antigen ligase family protein [Cytophagales bacterium]
MPVKFPFSIASKKSKAHLIFYVIIFFFPILTISTPNVTTGLATIIFLLCSIGIFHKNNGSLNYSSDSIFILSLFSFLSYSISILLTQIYWGNFSLSEYQQQGRMILLLPLFLYIYYFKIDLKNILIISIPLACIISAISSLFVFNASIEQWGNRHTIKHIDPLNFGYLMLFLAFSSLMIMIHWTSQFYHKIFCMIAFFIGMYMSIKSGSRTGWLAIPVIVFFIIGNKKKLGIKSSMLLTISIILFGIFLYNISDIINARVNSLWSDLWLYQWRGNPAMNDTSIGIRISMIRMGYFIFSQSPIFGFGLNDLYPLLNTIDIQTYATDQTIHFASLAYMHNELITQLVKHGIFGGLAFLSIIYCIYNIYKKSKKYKIKSPTIDIFMIYIIFTIVASLSTEILVLKPMILFFSFMFACFAGETLWKIHQAKFVAHTHMTNYPRVN